MLQISAVFAGASDLLIHCAEAFLQAGHTVAGVETSSPEIRTWAGAMGIAVLGEGQGAQTEEATGFDFLFCLDGAPTAYAGLISAARKGAFRFHNSPVPPYTACQAPSWALINGQTRHGVTWHDLKGGPTGAAMLQRCFDITREDTAGSLHAKCYEAGIGSFEALLDSIGHGALQVSESPAAAGPLDPLLPPGLGTLDFSQPAKRIAALVAALDFDPLPNLFARAKIYLGDTFALVRSAQVLASTPNARPGMVVRAVGDSLQVATVHGDILLSGCTALDGQPLSPQLAPGWVLTSPGRQQLDRLARRASALAEHEPFWRQAFAGAAPADLPYPHKAATASSGGAALACVALASGQRPGVAVPAFFAWLSALTAQQQVSLMYSDHALLEQAAGLECWLSAWAPLTLTLLPGISTSEPAALLDDEIGRLRRAGPFACDLPARLSFLGSSLQRLRGIGVSVDGQRIADDMSLMLAVESDGFSLQLVSHDGAFPAGVLTTMASHFSAFLAAFAAGGTVGALPLVPEEEAARVALINSTALPYDLSSSIQSQAAAQALRTPDRAAVCLEDQVLTYSALEERADELCGRLRLRGVGPGHVIGICLQRNLDLLVCLQAVFKAGAAYLPLDPDYPKDRLSFMVADSGTPLVLTTCALAQALSIPHDKAFLLDAPAGPNTSTPVLSATPTVDPSVAYLMYTSGSTGRPKGAVITQRNLLHVFAAMDTLLPAEPPGRWLAASSFSFDISIPELWWTLARGFTVVIYPQAGPRWSVAAAILQNKITHFFCTPSLVSMLMADTQGRQALSRLSVLMVGGEVFPLQLAQDVRATVAGKVFNIYGPTEITVFSNAFELTQLGDFVPLGPPIANTTLSVRTAHGAECPAWVAGELFIGGDGVSNGYWRRPKLNAQKFFPDPARPGGSLYRTGDLVRRRPGGEMEFVGRIDYQIKIRGHRVELGEIENIISQVAGVKDVVVLAPEDKFGDRRLLAYVVPHGGQVLEPAQIKSAVAAASPAIMVPESVVMLGAFALTPNGKIDRRVLPSSKTLLDAPFNAAPAGELETSVAQAWEEALGQGPIKADDSFFGLGGSFLSAVRAQRRLQQITGRSVDLSDMVRFSTPRALARHLAAGSGDSHEDAAAGPWPVEAETAYPEASPQSQSPELTVAPTLTRVESAVADIWRDLFGIEQVGKDDEFFDLGGNSLAAVRMFAQLRKQFPVTLPLASLFESSSLAGFSALVESSMRREADPGEMQKNGAEPDVKKGRPAREWSTLVPIRRGSAGQRPLFCIHGAGGNVFNFKALSQNLGADQPVYALQPQGVDGHLPMLGSIEAMAAQYVAAVRAVDPRGPYRLLGYSAGGVIAFEMAQQLKNAGAEIALLAMIDSLTPAAAVRKPGIFSKLWLMRHWTSAFVLERYRHQRAQEQLKVGYAEVTEKLARGEWLTPELVELHLFCKIVEAQNRYVPGSFEGSMLLFKASDATTQYLHAGEFLGWEAHVNGPIRVLKVPGTHESMMTGANLRQLGAALSQELNSLDLAVAQRAATPARLPGPPKPRPGRGQPRHVSGSV